MSNERDSRTVELDREQLAELLAAKAKEAAPGAPAEEVAEGDLAVGSQPHAPAASRTATLHDPLTMALLAEVARDSRTLEMDPQTIADALEAAGATEPAAPDAELAHPHLKRRG